MHAHASTTTDGTTGSDTTDGTLYAVGVLSTVCWCTVLLLVVMVCYSVCSLSNATHDLTYAGRSTTSASDGATHCSDAVGLRSVLVYTPSCWCMLSSP